MNIVVCVDAGLVSQDASIAQIGKMFLEANPNLKTVIEPASVAALQLASTLSTQNDTISAISFGGSRQQAALEYALAFGADSLIQLKPQEKIHFADPQLIASALAEWLKKNAFDLIICGNGSGTGLVPSLLATYLDIPSLPRVDQAELTEPGCLEIVQRLEQGWRQRVKVKLPALITVQWGYFPCRYVSVRRRRMAQQHMSCKVEVVPIHLRMREMDIQSITAPKPRAKRTNVPDAKQSAADRIKALMGGAMRAPLSSSANSSVQQDEKRVVEESPQIAAEEIFKFLQQKELLPENFK
jgi:electron transfer flavoprotein alpha/beta subunit